MRLSALQRRLLPIFIGKFFRNIVFWYSIEKLFMASIGFSDVSIGAMVAVYSFMSVLMEVPSGILADRWSRKGVLALASLSLLISSMFGWVANDILVYLFCAIFWGFFDALASGTDTSQLYDTLLEEQGHARNFQKLLGRYEALGGVALIVSAIVGGIIAESLSLRDAFLLSAIPSFIAIIATLMVRETTIHKLEHQEHIIAHTINTFRVLFRNSRLLWILVAIIAIMIANAIIGEMYQLWYLAVSVQPALYGIAGGIILSTYGIGGIVTEFFTTKRRIITALVIALCASVATSLVHNFVVIVAAQFVIGFICFTLYLVLSAYINHELPSRYRAGAGSAINSASRLLSIPVMLLFGWISDTKSIFMAAGLMVTFIALALVATIKANFSRAPQPAIIDTPY